MPRQELVLSLLQRSALQTAGFLSCQNVFFFGPSSVIPVFRQACFGPRSRQERLNHVLELGLKTVLEFQSARTFASPMERAICSTSVPMALLEDQFGPRACNTVEDRDVFHDQHLGQQLLDGAARCP